MRIRTLFLAVWLSLFAGTLSAQSNGEAILTDEGRIVLSEDAALQHSYSIEVSMDEFSNYEDAAAHFKSLNSALVTYRVNYGQEKVYAILNLKNRPNWSTADWNAHFESVSIASNLTNQD